MNKGGDMFCLIVSFVCDGEACVVCECVEGRGVRRAGSRETMEMRKDNREIHGSMREGKPLQHGGSCGDE